MAAKEQIKLSIDNLYDAISAYEQEKAEMLNSYDSLQSAVRAYMKARLDGNRAEMARMENKLLELVGDNI